MSDLQNDINGKSQYSLPSSSLDIPNEALQELAVQSVAVVTEYFSEISQIPLFQYPSAKKLVENLSSELPTDGASIEQLMAEFRSLIPAGRNTGHPSFFGYVGSVSTPIGPFADLLASTLNQNVTCWRASPLAVTIERTVVRWLSLCIGYGENAHGLLTSGTSIANLQALLIAHRVKSPKQVSQQGLWNAGIPMTIYASDQVHFSILKAADVLGFGRDYVRLIKSDSAFRLNVSSLRDSIEADLKAGFLPFCVVANAGTVGTGAVDPLAEIAEIAQEYGLWLHVDGAYGAVAALDESKHHLFNGIESADSVAIDPHKWLYMPYDCGCLLFHNEAAVRNALSVGSEEYIRLHEQDEAESFAFWDYSLELSRRFRALKIWMTLRYYGLERIRAAISENNALAEYLAERVKASIDFELLAPVELSICCFRYLPLDVKGKLEGPDTTERLQIDEELNKLNANLMYTLQRDGRIYPSNITINGRYALRVCIINFRTTRADIDNMLAMVRDKALTLEISYPSLCQK